MLWECAIYLFNMIIIGGLSWHAFRQSEREEQLTRLNRDILDNNDDLIMINLELAQELAFLDSCIKEIESERDRLQQMYDERPGMVEHRVAETILDALDTLKRNCPHADRYCECEVVEAAE